MNDPFCFNLLPYLVLVKVFKEYLREDLKVFWESPELLGAHLEKRLSKLWVVRSGLIELATTKGIMERNGRRHSHSYNTRSRSLSEGTARRVVIDTPPGMNQGTGEVAAGSVVINHQVLVMPLEGDAAQQQMLPAEAVFDLQGLAVILTCMREEMTALRTAQEGARTAAQAESEIVRAVLETRLGAVQASVQEVSISINETRETFGNRLDEVRSAVNGRLEMFQQQNLAFQEQVETRLEVAEVSLRARMEERVLELVAPVEARCSQFVAQVGVLKEEAEREAKRLLTEAEAKREAARVEAAHIREVAQQEAVRLSEGVSPPPAVWGLVDALGARLGLQMMVDRVPHFNNHTGENPVNHLKKLSSLWDGQEVPWREKKRLIAASLEGVALCWWSSVEEEVDSWSTFESLFRQEFWSPEIQGLTRATLHAMKYREGGNKSMEAHLLTLLDRSRHLDVPMTDSELVNVALGQFPLRVQEVLGVVQQPGQLKGSRPDVVALPPQQWGSQCFSQPSPSGFLHGRPPPTYQRGQASPQPRVYVTQVGYPPGPVWYLFWEPAPGFPPHTGEGNLYGQVTNEGVYVSNDAHDSKEFMGHAPGGGSNNKRKKRMGQGRSNAYVLFDPGIQPAQGVFNSESLKPWKPDV
uniref:Retrotransposon gag domain-containing protein n=1 Tax=Timema poppense TaxID=170557 RepID=A0A7R9CP20_TIMPO|nr:unnamed protein product [Timema poppensis]